MARILDIAGKPLSPRNSTRRRMKAQDMRDLTKIMATLVLIVSGYFLFAPENRETADNRVAVIGHSNG
ncbi:MAG TPA: hypothetical protein VGN36_03645 [Sphingorhabdus sp.]|jgi:alpha-beta hydrolase superfamily lysophospholipase|nr:hypothetical protein [Sphingorhabdus sp.]